MRLTLRSLLAYLDDALGPAETREIGTKIQGSPVAQAMVSRIREVMRRRRLGAPDLEGPGVGIDPNIVAQYLDNTLPPAEVGDVEKVFLESDQQLAEVAACHQILTIALGEPVDISKRSRERLYVLGPVEAGQKLQPAEPVHRGNGEGTLQSQTRPAAGVVTVPSPSFEETLPEYLRPKPWSGKVLMAVGLILLLAVWLAAVVMDQPLMTSLTGLRPERSLPSDVVAKKTEPAAETAAAEQEAAKTEVAVVVPTPLEPEAGTEQPAAAVAAEVVKPLAEQPVIAEIEAPADAALAVAVVTPAAPEPKPPTENAPVAVPPMSVQAVSPEGILLALHPGEKRWYVVPRLSDLKLGTRLACPEPFESVLEFDQGAMRVTLLGGTVVDLLRPSDKESAALRLVNGRMVLQTRGKDNEPLRIGFAIGPRTGELEIAPGDTLFGVEYLLAKPTGFEEPAAPESRLEGMYVLAGDVTWKPDGAARQRAERGSVYVSLLTDQMPLNFGPPISSNPVWLDPQRRKAGATLARWARQFEQEFEATQPIDSSMLALLRDSRSKIAELAVRCLALTDNPTAVVQALAQADSEDARKAADDGLREWLGVSVKRGEQLKQALQKYYEREEEIDIVYRLLWGISETEAKDLRTSLELIEWLRSDKVEIRELAFDNLVRLTGRKYDYRPLSSPLQREPAIKRWFDYVNREGGLVKAKDEGGG